MSEATTDLIPVGGETPFTPTMGEGLWMHFSSHTTDIDATGIDLLLAQATTYIPEYPNAIEATKKQLQRISQGNYKELQAHKGFEPFYETVASMLYKRPAKPKLAVELVDVPFNSIWNERMLALRKAYKEFAIDPQGLEPTLERYHERIKTIADVQAKREEVIAANIAKTVPRILDTNESAGVLMTVGSLHSTLVEKAKSQGVEAHSTRAIETIPLNMQDSLTQSLMRGEEIDAANLVTAMLQGLVYNATSGMRSSDLRTVAAIDTVRNVDIADRQAILDEALKEGLKSKALRVSEVGAHLLKLLPAHTHSS